MREGRGSRTRADSETAGAAAGAPDLLGRPGRAKRPVRRCRRATGARLRVTGRTLKR